MLCLHARVINTIIVPFKTGPNLGNWDNGMSYAVDIMDDLHNWVSGSPGC